MMVRQNARQDYVHRQLDRYAHDNSAVMVTDTSRIVWLMFLFLVVTSLVIIGVFFIGDYAEDQGKISRQTQRTCGAGNCTVNTLSGIKTCPKVSTEHLLPTEEEVCVAPNTCPVQVPFAISKRDHSALTPFCDEGDDCNCIFNARCPRFLTSYFRKIDHATFAGNYSRQSFEQKVNKEVSLVTGTKIQEIVPPFNIDPNSKTPEVCTVSTSIARSIFPTRCIRGILAEIVETDLGSKFDPMSADTFPSGLVLGCVNVPDGTLGEGGGLPVYIRKSNQLRQIKSNICGAEHHHSYHYDDYYTDPSKKCKFFG